MYGFEVFLVSEILWRVNMFDYYFMFGLSSRYVILRIEDIPLARRLRENRILCATPQRVETWTGNEATMEHNPVDLKQMIDCFTGAGVGCQSEVTANCQSCQ